MSTKETRMVNSCMAILMQTTIASMQYDMPCTLHGDGRANNDHLYRIGKATAIYSVTNSPLQSIFRMATPIIPHSRFQKWLKSKKNKEGDL